MCMCVCVYVSARRTLFNFNCFQLYSFLFHFSCFCVPVYQSCHAPIFSPSHLFFCSRVYFRQCRIFNAWHTLFVYSDWANAHHILILITCSHHNSNECLICIKKTPNHTFYAYFHASRNLAQTNSFLIDSAFPFMCYFFPTNLLSCDVRSSDKVSQHH